MKQLRPLLCLVALSFCALRAAEDPQVAAVRAADEERIAATLAADRGRLTAIYSDALHYAHSNGKVDTKSSQIQGLVEGPSKYEGFDYAERTFLPTAPGVMLMKGRGTLRVRHKTTGQPNAIDMNFLAVWRLEQGRWRFLAWQSCRNPPPAETKK